MTIPEIQSRLVELGFGSFKPTGFYGPATTAAVLAFQKANGLTADGICGPKTMAALFPPLLNKGKYLIVSQKAIDLIVFSEVTSEKHYNEELKWPSYPGLGSGVTIGIGYDLGYNTRAQIAADWKDLVSDKALMAMLKVSGLKGAAAKNALAEARRDIEIPFKPARKVFLERTLPRYTKDTVEAYPKAGQLFPDASGGLLSLVFNRGNLIDNTDRRKEMKAIARLVAVADYNAIADQIISMKRLWDGVRPDGQEKRVGGLLTRRDDEAGLVKLSNRVYKTDELVYINIA